MNQIVAAVLKAVCVTFVSTMAAIIVDKIRRYNEDKNEDNYYQPNCDEYDRW